MRTTVTIEPDVLAELTRLRREEHLGLSEALNRLARAGLGQKQERRRFRQRTYPLGLKIDVTNVEDAIELLEGPAHR